MKKYQIRCGLIWVVFFFILSAGFSKASDNQQPVAVSSSERSHTYDLVLVHGLGNKHRWGKSFLDSCLTLWGSGRVFVIHTNKSLEIREKIINGRTVTYCGGDGNGGGIESIADQSQNLFLAIDALRKSGRLHLPFSIIAHSMGGLVSRYYSYSYPSHVAALVTLGTPHHGSPLADSFKWVGLFIGAEKAIEDLKPDNVKRFNRNFPIEGTPLTTGGPVHLIRGDCDGLDCFGWAGELMLGYRILSILHETDNDGLVPEKSAVIEGAQHISDFPDYDHLDLVREPAVAVKAAEYLP